MQVKVAAVQMDTKIADLNYNLRKTKDCIKEAASEGASLIVFPECSLTGYCFENEEETRANAISIVEPWIGELIEVACQTNSYSIVGFVEREEDNIYNSLLIIGPNGVLGKYRKVHLPQLGVDNFVSPGKEPFSVIDTPIGKIGPLICYDIRFPEQARIQALLGADILVHITNLPLTASAQVDFLLPARANENRVYVLSSDRVGQERGFSFLGRSSIYGLNGETLAQGNEVDEMIIYADLNLSLAREKNIFYPAVKGKPTEHINRLFASRRPDLYQELTVINQEI